MKKSIILILLVIVFTSCAKNYSTIQEKPNYISEEFFSNISKNAVLEAIKKTYIFTSDNFEINSYRDKLVIRQIIIYPISFNTLVNTWYFKLESNDKGTKVFLYEEQRENIEDGIIYKDKKNHKIIFSKIKYFLSLRDSWDNCEYFNSSLNSFCFNAGNFFKEQPEQKDKVKNTSLINESKTLVDIHDDIILRDNFLISKYKKDILVQETTIDDKIIKHEDYKEIDAMINDIKEHQNKR
ncbi:MAG: hypothetical protein COA66_10070 [Arcobacter sp.]|nr:MAG: hypothetical protein COA66_10070 [Arcobacter sp.]